MTLLPYVIVYSFLELSVTAFRTPGLLAAHQDIHLRLCFYTPLEGCRSHTSQAGPYQSLVLSQLFSLSSMAFERRRATPSPLYPENNA